MDARLNTLIRDYQQAVTECVELLVLAGAKLPSRDYEWPSPGFEGTGTLADGRKYFTHGVGVAIRTKNGRLIDFDFGDHGETNGFSESRLLSFLGSQHKKYGFEARQEMIDCYRAAVSEFVFSGHILYYYDPRVSN